MTLDAVIIGAGPGGLATSRQLARRGIRHVVLERGERLGNTWANLYDSLVLHTGKHMSALPGLTFPASAPLFPRRLDFLDYLDRYASTFDLPIQVRSDVVHVDRSAGGWLVRTSSGEAIEARNVVTATGIASNPVVPDFQNRALYQGRISHSITYKNADGFNGRRVLVVGTGNSAGEIAAEISRAGAEVTLAVRSGANVLPRQLLGVPVQYLALPIGYLPKRAQAGISFVFGRIGKATGRAVLPPPRSGGCLRVPLIGFHLVDRIRQGAIQLKGDIDAFTPEGVRFRDGTTLPFDDVILATGFRAAIDMFGSAVNRDRCGFALRNGRVASADLPNLFFVGQNPDIRGGIYAIGRDAKQTARLIKRTL